MALVMIEGFETRNAKSGWFISTTQTTAGRFGGICCQATPIYTPPTPIDEFVLGYAWKIGSDSTLLVIESMSGTGAEISLHVTSSRAIELRRSTNVFLAITSGPVGDYGQWVYVEIMGKIADVGGYLQVRVNGNVVLDYVGDTRASSSGSDFRVDRFEWTTSGTNLIDDVYLCDRTGSEFNNYLGEIQVVTLSPNGNGAFSQLVGSDGNSTDNYLLVDELPAVDTDYVGSATVGQRDTYVFQDPTVPGQYLAVQTSAQISKTVAGDASVRLIQRLANGTEHESDPFVASNLRWVAEQPRTRDPENGIWTMASIAASEFGVEVA